MLKLVNEKNVDQVGRGLRGRPLLLFSLALSVLKLAGEKNADQVRPLSFFSSHRE